MILGVGIDVCDVARFAASLARTPALEARLFTPGELELAAARGPDLGHASLAARFAAKEALAKSLGAPVGLAWTDAEVHRDEHGRPWLAVTGSVQRRAEELGVRRLHVSLSHDAGIASAVVIAED